MTGPVRRRSGEADARLDELLKVGAPPHPLLTPQRARLPVALVLTALASGMIYTLGRVAGVTVPYLVVAAICVGVLALWLVLRSVTEPAWLRIRGLTAAPRILRARDPSGWYLGGDGMLTAVRRWDRRLEWGLTHPARFASTTLPRLGELIDERLRQHHGITRATDPARARALLGENLWALLAPRLDVPSHRELMAALADLERL
jgi:hypothetical protein